MTRSCRKQKRGHRSKDWRSCRQTSTQSLSSNKKQIAACNVHKHEKTLSSIASKDDVRRKKAHTVAVDSRATEQAENKLSYFGKIQEVKAI